MILGVGVDVVGLERFGAALRRAPALLGRLFTDAEAGLALESLAARFAAKEALAKALGAPGGLVWRDAQVLRGPGGRPVLEVSGTVARAAEELGVQRWHVSMSHDAGVATALVVAEGAPS